MPPIKESIGRPIESVAFVLKTRQNIHVNIHKKFMRVTRSECGSVARLHQCEFFLLGFFNTQAHGTCPGFYVCSISIDIFIVFSMWISFTCCHECVDAIPFAVIVHVLIKLKGTNEIFGSHLCQHISAHSMDA